MRTSMGEVYYEERGSGLPVVMLHASLHDHQDFDAVAERLSGRFRTIAVDWPGHGQSDAAAVGAPALADTLEEIVAGLDLPPAVFIGNSVGGYAAARLAVTHPERVAGLVLVNAAGFTKLNALSRLFCTVLGTPGITRRVLPRLVPGYMKVRNDADRAIADRAIASAGTADGARTGAALWRSFKDSEYDLRSRAGQISAPVLLVWGARDTILPLKAGRETHAALPGSRLEVLDTGHVVFASAPDEFVAIVEPFIAAAGDGARAAA